ncbi:MAG: XdhC/CoxI family protein [Candidatus Euphemobacter frigidus]|nr:XdhC/CoxI family protein [Candidatus Euphemobacter frigidus]MDP8274993.1 XdhC/CoxI family protein [Candidatus Euphemobacter frigidus]
MNDKIYQEVLRLLQNQEKAVLVSIASVRSLAPSETATGILVGPEGRIDGSIGGGEIEERVIEMAKQVLKEGKARRIEIGVSPEEEKRRGMLPGGTLKFYVEPIDRIPRLCVFGAGALAVSLSRIGRLAGFLITVVDYDPAFANRERFPDAEVVLTDNFRNLLDRLAIESSWYLLIATRNHRHDKTVLKQVIYSKVAYIGIIFSRNKQEAFFRRLEAEGIPGDLLRSIHLPAGIPIGAATLKEIAISIIAQIIEIRHNMDR